MFEVGGAEVAEDLSDVFVCDRANGFEFYNDPVVDDEVGHQITEKTSVFIVDFDRVLLFDLETFLTQSIPQGVLIDLLEMPVLQIGMSFKARLANRIHQFLRFRVHQLGAKKTQNTLIIGAFCVFCASCGYFSFTATWRWEPRPSTPHSKTSPSCTKRGGSKPSPTPAGVPVEITSPGSRDMNLLT